MTRKRGKLKLRPRARIVNTIGKELIRNEVVALIELIKNAYDADASMVLLTFEPPLQPGAGAVIVEDDGFGMDMKTVRTAWMEPATVSKLRKRTSPSGRSVTGEKGIGRFAAARIGRKLVMSSVADGAKERIQVTFNWGDFDNEKLYLDQVQCKWTSVSDKNARRGTVLRLEGLNDIWTEQSFIKLRAELARLVAPGPAKKDFAISLLLPEPFEKLSGDIGSPPILAEPIYRMHGSVTANGLLTATYTGPDGPKEYKDEPLVLEKREDGKNKQAKKLASGPFTFNIDVWDREESDLEPLAAKLHSTVSDLRRDLNASCGISVYRDGFRLLMANNDWLGLDLRRVQNPTLRLSNNQIVSVVSISAASNPQLKDQSNREGIVEGPAYADFREAILSILSKIEARRQPWRQQSEPNSRPLPGVFNQLDISPIAHLIREKYPTDRELVTVIDRTEKTFQHGIQEVQNVVARYRRLATLGQLVDVILHEGRTPVAAISGEAEMLELDLQGAASKIKGQVQRRVQAIHKQTKLLSALFDKIAPFSGKKRGRPEKVVIESAIEDAVLLLGKQIKDGKIRDISLPKTHTIVNAHASDLTMIFFNLLNNAVYWVQQMPIERRRIAVQVRVEGDSPVVIVSDDGPGVPDDHARSIFNPYFSLKPDGVGLGLTIAGEAATELGGGLELLKDGPLRGATFQVRLGIPVANG